MPSYAKLSQEHHHPTLMKVAAAEIYSGIYRRVRRCATIHLALFHNAPQRRKAARALKMGVMNPSLLCLVQVRSNLEQRIPNEVRMFPTPDLAGDCCLRLTQRFRTQGLQGADSHFASLFSLACDALSLDPYSAGGLPYKAMARDSV